MGPYKPNMKNTVDLTIDHFPLLALWVNHSIPKQVYGKGWALYKHVNIMYFAVIFECRVHEPSHDHVHVPYPTPTPP